jgi:hypothetical protein
MTFPEPTQWTGDETRALDGPPEDVLRAQFEHEQYCGQGHPDFRPAPVVLEPTAPARYYDSRSGLYLYADGREPEPAAAPEPADETRDDGSDR